MEDLPPFKKRRIPKACKLCRSSKLKCDGGKPCARCRNMRVECDYIRIPEDPLKEKVARLESELESLRDQIRSTGQPDTSTAVTLLQLQQQGGQSMMPPTLYSPNFSHLEGDGSAARINASVGVEGGMGGISNVPPPTEHFEGPNPAKRKRGDFKITVEENTDVIAKGVISYEDALLYFQTFFQGCDKYVPIFCPTYDTFPSIRGRSSILFNTICAIGCRAEHGPTSSQYQALSNAIKGPLSSVLLGLVPTSLETIQALLVNACYSEKGWLLTAVALKMAIDMDLVGAFGVVCERVLDSQAMDDDDGVLFREVRVWFGVFVLDNILSLDCGKKPGVTATDGMRRCRALLTHPARKALDLRLLSQVELNSIRALAHDRLSPLSGTTLSDGELSEIVQGTRIDLNIWLSDWTNIVETHIQDESERVSLIVNMRIQRYWGEMTMMCKGLQGIGIDNIAIMSDEQQRLIHLARASAQSHLSIMIRNSESYLGTFRYGMDFVWAKCAFSVLLLLKLARLIPSSSNMPGLISDAKILLAELSKARGSSNIYFRILCLTVEKCEKALKEDLGEAVNDGQSLTFLDAEMDFQSYVPKEFILEWNFPGLTFCWIPFDIQGMFLDFGT